MAGKLDVAITLILMAPNCFIFTTSVSDFIVFLSSLSWYFLALPINVTALIFLF